MGSADLFRLITTTKRLDAVAVQELNRAVIKSFVLENPFFFRSLREPQTLFMTMREKQFVRMTGSLRNGVLHYNEISVKYTT